MRYSVVIFPSSDIQELANSYRKRYDPSYALIPPFIRLKEAFEMDQANLPGFVNHLQQVAQSNNAFTIKFHRVSTFHPTNNVIYLGIQNKEPIETLHQQIAQYFPDFKETYAFVPHLTIGRNMTDDELKDVLGQLSMKKIDLSTEVDRFHLVYQLQDGMWSVYQTFLLNKQA